MRHRRLSKTGLHVSELGLGTWGLSGDGYGPVPEVEQDRVIDRARALGITLFETADSYAGGQMEARLGRRVPDDGTAHIVTKLGTDRRTSLPRKRFDAEYLRDAFGRSRDRLRRNVVSVVLLHNPSATAVEGGEATGLLEELRQRGELVAWGVSAGSVPVAEAAIRQGAAVVQLACNALFCGDLLGLRGAVGTHDVGVLAHSVLAYGLLSGHWAADKDFAEGDHRQDRWTAESLRHRLRQLDALRPAVGGPVLTLRAAALRYVLCQEHVSCAVLGPRSTLQLDQLVREAGKEPPYLPEDTLTALRTRLRQAGADA